VTTLPESGLVSRILSGDLRALARLATHIENDTPVGREGLRRLYPETGAAHIVGITGSPGAGKSTLVSALIRELRDQDKRIAVVAVDPSSPLSGGAALGDRIRMLDWWEDENVYIRSMASRGLHGGLAPATAGMIHLLDAARFDVILVETVGVGQEEVDILRYVHTVVVVQVPGLGDDIQAMKAGLLEVADLFVVNKSDREGAEDLSRTLRALGAYQSRYGESTPSTPIVKTVATTGDGIAELVRAIEHHRETLDQRGLLKERERVIAAAEVTELARRQIASRLNDPGNDAEVAAVIAEVAERKLSPIDAAETLLESWQLNSGN
jgi:LAO/AO transport system kinase